MAKIVVTIEDLPGDKVKIVSDPTMETLIKMEVSGERLTPAHGYAYAMLNKCREISKSQDPTNKIIIPRIGR